MMLRNWTLKSLAAAFCTAAACGWASMASAALIVNDTWQDGNRTDPATAAVTDPYSENGTDGDSDGDLESVWFTSTAAAMSVAPGHLTMTQQTGSSSYTTYFVPEAAQTPLAQGETLKVTWEFTPTGVGTDAGRGLRLALVDTAGANRLISNASPANSTFTGYRLSLNVSQSLIANSIELRERVQFASDNLLVNDDRWSGGIASVGAAGTTGFVAGTKYTLEWAIKRNFSDEMEIAATITGAGFANTGSLALAFTDTTANAGSFTFDTFAMRPSTAAATAATFDTTLFRVERIPIPEPAALSLLALGMALVGGSVRRR